MEGLRYLHIDDGYETSYAAKFNERHWSARLVNLLDESGYHVAEQALVTGEKLSVQDVSAELANRSLRAPFDIVTIQAGTWDLLTERTGQQLVADFGELLRRAEELAGGIGWHTVLIEPNTLACENVPEVERMNLIRMAGFYAIVERGWPHLAEIHAASFEIIERSIAREEKSAMPYAELSATHARIVFSPVAHFLSHPAPELQEGDPELDVSPARSLN